MNFKQHFTGGVVGSIVAATGLITTNNFYGGLDDKTILYATTMVLVGSLAPDLDTDSIPARWAARIGVIASILFIYGEKPIIAAVIGLVYMLMKCGKHRGFSHKYLTLAIIAGIGIYLTNIIIIGFASGMLIHFILDKISPFKKYNWI